MLLLRILTAPIAMASFVALYVLAHKVPEAGLANLIIWPALAVIVIVKVVRAACHKAR